MPRKKGELRGQHVRERRCARSSGSERNPDKAAR